MCGIACILEIRGDPAELRERAVAMARLLRHRGPDWSGVYADGNAVLAHERLSIVDVEHGAQPLTDRADELVLAVNGEIYNHRALRSELADYPFKTGSDCEVILPLYEREGAGFLHSLSGIFAFVLYDRRRNDYLIARDPIGVLPLYTGRDHDGNLHVASELKAMGIKMVLSGEGADEVFGGYLYFHKAPNAREFHEETVRKLDLLYKYDCLRANKSMAAWGVEARPPFLDREFLDVAMAFDPAEKMVGPGRMEKFPLRTAFAGYLPDEILWRQKEQFSDGVGYNWIDSLKAVAEARVSANQMESARYRFPHNPPATREAYLYRDIFESHFPGEAAAACVPGGPSIACSTPTAIAWDASFAANADPSGRAVLGVHRDARGGA